MIDERAASPRIGAEGGYPAIAELIPHEGRMVLLEQMLEWAPGFALCRMRVREGSPYVSQGELAAAFTLEAMAQCVAACLGYEAFRGGEGVRVGMIIACRRFTVHRAKVAAGRELSIRARRTRGNDSLSHFECEVRDSEESVADALLTLFHGERPPGF